MDMNNKLDLILSELKDMHSDMKEMRADIEDLKEGQSALRRDIARVERKIDRLSNDVGDTLAIITETTDYELSKIREAK